MASQERLEYFISAAFKDEGVKQALQSFAKLNSESAKVVRELDRVAQAGTRAGQSIRDSRTGFAQLGMQVNQLGTQVASGTSLVTAFTQQIGDVGWAMSNMGGVMGRVGSFLAGPWGIAVMGAAFVMGKLWDSTFKETKAVESLDDALNLAKITAQNYIQVSNLLAKSNGDVQRSAYGAAVATRQLAADTLKAAKADLAKYEAARLNVTNIPGMQFPGMQAVADVYAESGIQRAKKAIADSEKAFSIANAQINHMNSTMDKGTKIENAYTDGFADLQVQLNNGKINIAEFNRRHEILQATFESNTRALKAEEEAQRNSNRKKRESAAEARRVANEIKSQTSAYESLAEKLRDNFILRTQETNEIGRAKKALDDFNDLVNKMRSTEVGGKLVGLGFTQDNYEQIKATRDALKLAIIDAEEWKLMMPTAAMEAKAAWEEQTDAIKNVGMSVNDAFKGMLTAGMSWKDGMKGIINSVISELWRLFVVQQIVGMVTNFVGGLFGKAPGLGQAMPGTLEAEFDAAFASRIPGNANGTPSWKGGLTWVGERGPELVNLPRGAGVIPAHRAGQMGSGGMTINVDARGSADPAAVRAQVQQGILEAAPAIIAAAEQKTVMGLRRPKLGGVMQ